MTYINYHFYYITKQIKWHVWFPGYPIKHGDLNSFTKYFNVSTKIKNNIK